MTIRFPGRFKLGLVAQAKNSVAIAHQVFFNNERRPELVVTDGKMVAVIPVDVVEGAPKSKTTRVTGDAWALATTGQGETEREITLVGDNVIVRDDKGRQIMSVSAGEPSTKGFPTNYRSVIPVPGSQHVAVQLDPRQLTKLSRVLGTGRQVTLHMDADPKNGVVQGPIRVTQYPWSSDDSPHGALMPIAIQEDRRGKKLVIDVTK